jgi:hypothetical protein
VKLPETTRLQVQSLGRHDVSAPGRVASAQAAAAGARAAEKSAEGRATMALSNAVGDSIKIIGGIYEAAQHEKALNHTAEIKKSLDMAYTRATTQPAYDLNNDNDRKFLGNSTYDKRDAQGNLRTKVDSAEVMSQLWAINRDEIMKKGLDGLSPEQQRYVTANLREYLDGKDVDMARTSTLSKNSYMRESAIRTANEMVDAGDLTGGLAVLEKTVPFTEEQRLVAESNLVQRHEKNRLTDAIYAPDNGVSAMRMLNELQDVGYTGPLRPRDRMVAINALEAAITEKTSASAAASARRLDENAFKLEVGIEQGAAGQIEVADAFSRRDITFDEYKRLTLKSIKKSSTVAKANDDVRIVSQSMNRDGVLLNPANKDHRKAVESYVEQLGLENNPREMERVLVRTGIMPQKLQDHMESKAINGDEKQARESLNMYSRLEDTAPHLLHDLDDRAKTVLSMASVLSRNGIDPSQAILQSRKALLVAPEQLEFRKQLFRDEDFDVRESLSSKMDADERLFDINWYYKSDVGVMNNMLGEYGALTERYFMITGDMAQAEKMAYTGIQQTWGITETGSFTKGTDLDTGKRAMKYPPERTTNLTPMQTNLALKAFALDQGMNPEHIIVNSDARTARDRESWSIALYNPDTGLVDIPISKETGQPVRWLPQVWVQAGLAMQHAEQVAEAVEGREERKERLEKREPQKNIYAESGITKAVEEFGPAIKERVTETADSAFQAMEESLPAKAVKAGVKAAEAERKYRKKVQGKSTQPEKPEF